MEAGDARDRCIDEFGVNGNLESVIALVQGGYFLATGIWPIVSIRTFLKVTGPKTDLWLVKTVGALIVVIGAVLLLGGITGNVGIEVGSLWLGSAAVLGAVDVIYVSTDTIPKIYLLDAALEAVVVLVWAYVLLT